MFSNVKHKGLLQAFSNTEGSKVEIYALAISNLHYGLTLTDVTNLAPQYSAKNNVTIPAD
jgi:hypothetical protein